MNSPPLQRPHDEWHGRQVGVRPLRSGYEPNGHASTQVMPSRNRPVVHDVQFSALPEHVKQFELHDLQRPSANCDSSHVILGGPIRFPG